MKAARPLSAQATRSLFERRDTVVVATVSCIYGLGIPAEYLDQATLLAVGQVMRRNARTLDANGSVGHSRPFRFRCSSRAHAPFDGPLTRRSGERASRLDLKHSIACAAAMASG